MSEDKRKFEANAFYMQNAMVQPHPGHGSSGSSKQTLKSHQDGEGEIRGSSYTREMILRLIQSLKDK
jgi:hypothetical protein